MVTYEKFLQYHSDNPEVYRKFEEFTLQAIASGRKHFGAKAIAERLRWYTAIETRGSEFKIANEYISFYARLFEEEHPQYVNFFRKRRSVADQKEFNYA